MSRPPLIAIVDDDAAVREALGDLLQVAGLEGVAFSGGAELMEEDDPLRFDLVITDLKMPSMDGIELLRRLEATKASPPALVLTSCADEDMRARALQVGATDCLTKPVEDNVLLQRIEAILREAGKAPPRPQ